MKCTKPFVNGTAALPCGQCMPCRINRRRIWTHRLMLEATQHASNAFVTLTYADADMSLLSLPSGHVGNLVPAHLRDFLKRLRRRVEPTKLRYFAVGEYGDETYRPHYHIALFGYPNCVYGRSQYSTSTGRQRASCCSACDALRDTWGKGNIDCGILEPSSAAYVAGYVTKKMTFRDDPRLEGREPEFARMSLRPGIGLRFMDDYADSYLRFNLDARAQDVPSTARHGSKLWPLGRYLRRALRERVGRDAAAPRDIDREMEMLFLLEASIENERSLSEEIKTTSRTKIASLLAREKIYKQRKTL